METILEVKNLSKLFGGVISVENLSLQQSSSEVIGIIGPNGAGKSTLLNMLTGVYKPSRGQITFRSQMISNLPPHSIARLGIARTFQTPQIFGSLTLLDNVIVGLTAKQSWWKPTKQLKEKGQELLTMLGLEKHIHQKTSELSYGKKRLLEIARAMATNPSMILLDEPGAGMNPTELDELSRTLKDISARGVAVLLIEHNMRLVMNISDRVIMLASGKKVFDGTPEMAANDPVVVESYLGKRVGKW